MEPKADLNALVARMDGMQKAVDLLQANSNKMPSMDTVAGEVKQLREVTETKFDGIDARFLERDSARNAELHVREQAKASSVAMVGVVVQCVVAAFMLLGVLAAGIAYVVSRVPVPAP